MVPVLCGLERLESGEGASAHSMMLPLGHKACGRMCQKEPFWSVCEDGEE